MPSVRSLPRDDDSNGWNRILPPRTPKPALAGDVRADWVVVGAGFAGLAAARRLAENRPNETIALLEAQVVGEGTSGRNTGIAIDVPYNSGALSELENRRRNIRLNRAGIDYLDTAITKHAIECQWSKRGKYHAAVNDRGKSESLKAVAQELEVLGEPLTWLDRDELFLKLGTTYYCAAIHTPGAVLVNPAALTRGLADSLPANVTLYERSPVIEADYRSGIRLATTAGSLSARTLILATNGFAAQFGFFKHRLLVFAIYASLTRRLNPNEIESFRGEFDWGLTPANVMGGAAMRCTQDHRFLLRETVLFSPDNRSTPTDRAAVARKHQGLFQVRFRDLPEVSIEHTWVGFDSMSQNRTHGFGQVAPNVFAAVCQNGVGITKGTISGLLAADLATRRDNPLTADIVGLGQPNWLPPRPFLDIGVRARFAWDKWRARNVQ